jgi:hypothetical protein
VAGAPFVGRLKDDSVTFQAPVAASTLTHWRAEEFHSFCWWMYSPPFRSVVPHAVQSVTGAADAGAALVSTDAAPISSAAAVAAMAEAHRPPRAVHAPCLLTAPSPRRGLRRHTP